MKNNNNHRATYAACRTARLFRAGSRRYAWHQLLHHVSADSAAENKNLPRVAGQIARAENRTAPIAANRIEVIL
jgi:hypothetical protein